jgi:hypothetical protein
LAAFVISLLTMKASEMPVAVGSRFQSPTTTTRLTSSDDSIVENRDKGPRGIA